MTLFLWERPTDRRDIEDPPLATHLLIEANTVARARAQAFEIVRKHRCLERWRSVLSRREPDVVNYLLV